MKRPSKKESQPPPERSPRRPFESSKGRRGINLPSYEGKFVRWAWVLAVGFGSIWLGSATLLASRSSEASLTPSMPLTWSWITFATIVVLGLCAAFAGSETALEFLRQIHVRKARESGNEATASKLQLLVERRDGAIASCAIALQGSRLILFLLSLALALKTTNELSPSQRPALAVLGYTVAIAVPLVLIEAILELLPRSYASLHPEKMSIACFRLIVTARTVFAGPAWAITAIASVLAARFGTRATFALAEQAEEEIKNLVDSAQETGAIEHEEKELLHSVFEFGDTVVREVMTPRVDLDAMPLQSSPEAVVALIESSGHSRIPLFDKTDDAIIGIIHAKDLLMALMKSKDVSLRKLMRTPLFIPENKNVHDLLTDMRQSHTQMAIVQDEFGGTAGIVTIEDIVEELVGDIVDEYDHEEPEIVQTAPGLAIVNGKAHLDDINHALNTHFESEEFDTIGGYVFGLFGRQPGMGETIEDDDYRFVVSETDGRRIVKLRIEEMKEEEPAAEG